MALAQVLLMLDYFMYYRPALRLIKLIPLQAAITRELRSSNE